MNRILFVLLCFVSTYRPLHANEEMPKGKYDDVLVIVHYNHAYYSSADFIRGLYPCFPNMVFYGPLPGDNIYAVPTHEGHFLCRVLADALERFPDYKGYLVIQDDVLVNFWNYTNYSKDKIWFAVSFYRSQLQNETTPESWRPDFDQSRADKELFLPSRDAWWGRWNEPVIAVAKKQLLPKDLKMLKHNAKGSATVGMVCDLFYIPGRCREDALRLSKIYQDVFCEIAVPMVLCCLDPIENWQILKGVWQFGGGYEVKFTMDEFIFDDVDWVHPFKFSRIDFRNYAKQIVGQHLQNP